MSAIHIDDLNDLFEEYLGKSFEACQNDNGGCCMSSRNQSWLSPSVVTNLVEEILHTANVGLIETMPAGESIL